MKKVVKLLILSLIIHLKKISKSIQMELNNSSFVLELIDAIIQKENLINQINYDTR